MPNSKPKKLTRSQAARLGGLATRGISTAAKTAAAQENGKRGGRPRKYATDAERRAAHVERQRAYLDRKAKRET